MIPSPNSPLATCPGPSMNCMFIFSHLSRFRINNNSAVEVSALLESVETTLNGLPESLTDVPVVVSQVPSLGTGYSLLGVKPNRGQNIKLLNKHVNKRNRRMG
jgi:hypothetical protein